MEELFVERRFEQNEGLKVVTISAVDSRLLLFYLRVVDLLKLLRQAELSGELQPRRFGWGLAEAAFKHTPKA